MIERRYAELIVKFKDGKFGTEFEHLKPMLDSDGGHGMIFDTFEGKSFFTMHKPNAPATAERPIILPFKEKGCQVAIVYG